MVVVDNLDTLYLSVEDRPFVIVDIVRCLFVWDGTWTKKVVDVFCAGHSLVGFYDASYLHEGPLEPSSCPSSWPANLFGVHK